jgi:hypothetical protein
MVFSGDRKAFPIHKIHAGAQSGLHQLAAPLKAVRHAAEKAGNRSIEILARAHLGEAKLNPDLLEKNGFAGREAFRKMVGNETAYFRKQGHPL